jgi:myo-inositol-1-phosphate synthase
LGNPVRVAIIGVGNCASSFVQGVDFYKNARKTDFVPGLMHPVVGGYHVRDIEFVAAIDIDKNKVGKDLSEAIFTKPNNTVKFCDVPKKDVKVARGMTHDGLGKYLSEIIEKAPGPTADIVGILRETQADVVVNYLPVGSEEATKWYTEQILTAGCALVNCIPVFIAREPYWQKRFVEAGVPVIGDDIKSQVGATIVHRVLTRLMRERGVRLERTSQLNVGGNTDFLNMLERERLESKKISKTNAVTSQLDYDMGAKNVHIRRRSAQYRAQARGGRLAQLCRHRHRRGPLRQDRHGPRPGGGARGAEQLLHEVAAGAASGRPVPSADRGFHTRRGPRGDRRLPGLSPSRIHRAASCAALR